MTPQNIYYVVAIVTHIAFLLVFIWISVVIIKTLQSVRKIIEEIEDTAQNLSIVKEGFKVGILTFLGKLLGEKKEGEN